MELLSDDLPDTAKHTLTAPVASLDWVGMSNISLPLQLREQGRVMHTQASVDIGVNLPGGEQAKKGIHMSRLYRLVDAFSDEVFTPSALLSALQECITTHADCESVTADISLRFDLLVRGQSLLSELEGGWHKYPVVIHGRWQQGQVTQASVQVGVTYSSTCPCSAALSRAVLADAFSQAFAANVRPSSEQVSQWLLQHGSLATPHSQRSLASVRVAVDLQASAEFGLLALLQNVEQSLQTRVQTVVKRVDEQEFARLNGANLMYVEDAARNVAAGLVGQYQLLHLDIEHFESLHGHDAVSRIRNP